MHRSFLFSILITQVRCSFANLPQGQSMLEILKRYYENPNLNQQMYQNQYNQIMYKNPWQMEQVKNPIVVENNATANNNCCTNFPCPNPCFPPPVYSMPTPMIVPARTFFEPVVHDHPPLHKIKRIIQRDKRRWRKLSSSSSSSSNEFSSSAESDTDTGW